MCVLENSKISWPGQERTPKILSHASRHWGTAVRWSIMSIASRNCITVLSMHTAMRESSLGKLMAKPFKTPSNELADIAVNHFAIQHAREQVSHSSKPVDTICQDKGQMVHTSHSSHGHTPSAPSKDCPNCTQQHPAGRANCPSCDFLCSKCDKMGHWGPKCCGGKPLQSRNAPPPGSQQRKSRCPPRNHNNCQGQKNMTDTIDVREDHNPQDKIALHYIQPNMTVRNTHPEEITVQDVCAPQCNEAYTTIQLPASASRKGTASLPIKVDSRAGGNMLPCCVFWCLYPDQISPAGLPTGLDHISTRLTTYNGSHIPLYGALCGPITWQPDHPGSQPCRVNTYWYIADTPGPAILGLPSSGKLAVMKMNCAITVRQPGTHPAPVSTTAATTKPATVPEADKPIRSTDDLINEFPDRFKGIGRFPGKYKIWLCHDAHPMIHAPRKFPITLCPKVKEHLNKMECLGVITCVDEPMDWVSSITYIQKANGKLHLSLDPRDLNNAIHHDHHKTPTVEEVAHEFAHSCFFTKLDAHHGYWSIILDQDSSLLTTFNSPFGRYHFLQLLFGLVCSQDIFQKKMDQILEQCQGCIRITDDITIHGCTEAEHDACLWDLMRIAHKYDLVFNPQKTHMKAQAINFFGCLYNANGVHPDLGKVDIVHALPGPTNITELQEFLGLVTYLSSFIPGLSTLTTPLQELLKKDSDFIWNCTYDTTFEQIKEAIISDTILRYFDPSLPMTIQVDASKVGLGAALLQNGKPVAFASKALTETEHQYANIEREILATVFGAERFHTYVYGQSFTIESDHKPLESISRKNLADTPAWLQCIMLCLQGYDFTIHCHPCKEMVIPETLSQFSPHPGPELPLDTAIHHTHIMPDCKEAFQQAFINDPKMRALANLIITGWPEDIKEVPHPLHPYWQHQETLTVKDSLVLWGEALVIPPTKRERTLHQLHQFHQGITKSQLLMHGSFFWPSINKAIEEVVCQCEACTQFQSQNAAAPLTPTPTPSLPWQMCATDIFTL